MSSKEPDNKSHLFQPGQSGNLAGRPKDAINKPNLLKRSRELNIFPEDVLLHFVAGDAEALNLKKGEITAAMRLKATVEALKKMVPDLKSIDHVVTNDTDEDDTPMKTVIIVPSNTREISEDDSVELLPVDEIATGMNKAVKAGLDDPEL